MNKAYEPIGKSLTGDIGNESTIHILLKHNPYCILNTVPSLHFQDLWWKETDQIRSERGISELALKQTGCVQKENSEGDGVTEGGFDAGDGTDGDAIEILL